jgi:hypothetical protein
MRELRNLDTGRARHWNGCWIIRLLLSRVSREELER